MNLTIHPTERKIETQAREALQAALEPGETLLEYTQGKYRSDIFTGKEYWIGLSDRRLMLIPPRHSRQVHSILLNFHPEHHLFLSRPLFKTGSTSFTTHF